jgi:hypothetical protein
MQEIRATECLLLERIAKWNENQSDGSLHQIHLSAYYRQYCAAKDTSDHRIICLSAFYVKGTPHSDWKKKWVGLYVVDGGEDYFDVVFDMTEGRVVRFSIHSRG